jgi:hypothetical protein
MAQRLHRQAKVLLQRLGHDGADGAVGLAQGKARQQHQQHQPQRAMWVMRAGRTGRRGGGQRRGRKSHGKLWHAPATMAA